MVSQTMKAVSTHLAVDSRFRQNRPQYDLYIRQRDHAMCLVERRSQRHITIEAMMPGKYGGMYIRPREACAVFLMDDEIHQVEELPEQ